MLTGERSTCRPITSLSLLQSKLSVKFQKHFSTEKAFPQDINQFKEKTKLSSGSLVRKKLRDQFFEEQRDHLLAEAKSEILKEECKVDSLNICIREFQRQARSNCLELDSANCGFEESRREQTRLSRRIGSMRKKHFEKLGSEVSMKCEQYTHKNSTCRVAQHIITRTRVAQD